MVKVVVVWVRIYCSTGGGGRGRTNGEGCSSVGKHAHTQLVCVPSRESGDF